MNLIFTYHWELFIVAEILSFAALILFCLFRYYFDQPKRSFLFIFIFLLLLILEAIIGVIVYRETGEVSTFLIVITIFIVYACTFGIFDFIRLDRWMRRKIGKWRGVELLTQKDYDIIQRNSDPSYIARKYRTSSFIHLVVFVVAQSVFWLLGTGSIAEAVTYLTDLSWIEEGVAEASPYPNETLYSIGLIWGIVFIVDAIYSWSYTLFPSKQKG